MKFFTVVFFCLLSGNLLAGESNNVQIQKVGVHHLDVNDPNEAPFATAWGVDYALVTFSPRPDWINAECTTYEKVAIVGLGSGGGKAMLATALTAKANGLFVEVSSKAVTVVFGDDGELPLCVVTSLIIN